MSNNGEFKFDEKEYKEHISNVLKEMVITYKTNVIVVNDLLDNKKALKVVYNDLYNFMKQGFEVKEVRNFPIKFMFNNEDTEVYVMQANHMILNLIMWQTFIDLEVDKHIDASHIVEASTISTRNIKDYIDKHFVIPYRTSVKSKTLNIALHDLRSRLATISRDFNVIMAMSINMESFIKAAKENPRFNEIIRTKVDDSLQPVEIEEILNSLMKEEVEILKNVDNVLKPILCSNTGIKDQQLREFSVNGGLKPDLSGNTVPIPINSNFLVGGLSNIINYYMDATGLENKPPMLAIA